MATALRTSRIFIPFWIGVAAATTAEAVILGTRLVDRQAAEQARVTYLLFALFLFGCYLAFVYRAYAQVRSLQCDRVPRTAGEAVISHLIPIYNIAFMVRWPRELLRAVAADNAAPEPAPWWPGIALVCGFLIGAVTVGGAGLVVGLVLARVAREITDSQQTHAPAGMLDGTRPYCWLAVGLGAVLARLYRVSAAPMQRLSTP